MKSILMSLLLIAIINIREMQSKVVKSISQIDMKVKQIENLMDSQDYDSVNNLEDSRIFVKNFDYYTPSKATTPTTKPITTAPSGDAQGGKPVPASAAAFEASEASDGEGGGGSTMIIVGVVVAALVVVAGGAVAMFFYMRQNRKPFKYIKKKPRRGTSRESLSSIETVASDTGKPIHAKPVASGSKGSAGAGLKKK